MESLGQQHVRRNVMAFSLFVTKLGMVFFMLLLYGFDNIERIFGCPMGPMIAESWTSLGERLSDKRVAIVCALGSVRCRPFQIKPFQFVWVASRRTCCQQSTPPALDSMAECPKLGRDSFYHIAPVIWR